MSLEVIKNSGLRQKTELEALLGVSRMSVYKYFNGKAKPRQEVAKKIQKLAVLVKTLTEKGLMPFTDKTDEDRRKALVSKLNSVLNSN